MAELVRLLCYRLRNFSLITASSASLSYLVSLSYTVICRKMINSLSIKSTKCSLLLGFYSLGLYVWLQFCLRCSHLLQLEGTIK